MTRSVWKEATPQHGWPQTSRDQWPDEAEYQALREAKAYLEKYGPNQTWCSCGICKASSDHSWAIIPVIGQYLTYAGVQRARNRYGLESCVYLGACQDSKQERRLMRWDGVPLRAHEQPKKAQVEILHGTVVHHHHAGIEHIHHNYRSTW